MKKLLLFAMLFATVAMTSCSKSASSPTLVGKWKLVSYVSKEGSTTTFNYTGVAADYMDFKTNGTVETYLSGSSGTSDYTLNGSKLVLDGQTYNVSLTSTTATLTYSELVGNVRYEEIVNLKK